MAEILLLNPWITDFAAYDLWARPLGLLYLGARLRQLPGVEVRLLDCLDQSLLPPALAARVRRRPDGRGHYYRETVSCPEPLRHVRRRYRRYGLPEELMRRHLRQLPPPDVVLVTSRMTYWYPGVQQAIAVVREELPLARVVLGGIYPSLCPEHARKFSGADAVVAGSRLEPLWELLAAWGIIPASSRPEGQLFAVPPAWDLYAELPYLVLLASLGCPYRCPYCASALLYPRYRRRTPAAVLAELATGIARFPALRDVAFYDDALLLDADRCLLPFLELACSRFPGLRFHTPNGLHVRVLDVVVARALKAAGFRTIRLSLETVSDELQRQWGGKTGREEFSRAVENLVAAGFPAGQLEVYLLVGVPGQRWEQAREAVAWVKSLGLRPRLTEYSPLPGTPMWAAACRAAALDLEKEPLYHNNTLVVCGGEEFAPPRLQELKALARE